MPVPDHWLIPESPQRRRVASTTQAPNADEGLTQSQSSDGFQPSSPSPLPEGHSHNPRKRPAEDMGQYAEHIGRKLRLTTEACGALKDFSQLSAPQQSLWIAGHILGSEIQMSSLVPAESVYRIPSGLEGRVDMAAFKALVDHTAPSYVAKSNGPTLRVLKFLEKHPSWGLTLEVKSDKPKYTVIQNRVRDKLTHYRNLIKVAIEESLGGVRDSSEVISPGLPTRKDALDIVTLCQRILAIGAKVAPDVKTSMELVARVAYLRHHYQAKENDNKHKAPQFWESVDSGLAEIRALTRENKEETSRLFSRSLRDDQRMYGEVQLDHLATETPTLLD
ncbi:hypothetical protein C8R43DRAFT_1141002 [Mycena crocata]|nr:hypothetical protein C8R43DRAFT_1141002 [Mycena crocata]